MKANKFHIRKDDKVKVIAGKDKGKVGKVLKVIREDEKVVVENINMVKRHARPSAQHRQGGIIENEAAIRWSNVMLMCNKCMNPVRVQMRTLEDGKKVRVCRKCSETIDK